MRENMIAVQDPLNIILQEGPDPEDIWKSVFSHTPIRFGKGYLITTREPFEKAVIDVIKVVRVNVPGNVTIYGHIRIDGQLPPGMPASHDSFRVGYVSRTRTGHAVSGRWLEGGETEDDR